MRRSATCSNRPERSTRRSVTRLNSRRMGTGSAGRRACPHYLESRHELLALPEMLIKPIGQLFRIPGDVRPAVPGALLDHQLRFHAGLLELGRKRLRLLKRHQLVLTAV